MLLQGKNAVIYGAGGAIGSAVARELAKEGAKVFLTGRKLTSLERVANDIAAKGGHAEVAVVDAMDEHAVNKHFNEIAERAGRIEISFNAISVPQSGVQGIPLTMLDAAAFTSPVTTYTQSNFITAKAAGRHMAENGTGVILTLTAPPSRIAAPLVGGMAPSWAAIEALTRTFATELGPKGVRVLCLRPDALPETDTITTVYGLHAKAMGLPSHKEFQTIMEGMTMLKRLPTLAQVAATAAFMASDYAGAITGTVINLSGGTIAD